MNHGDIGSADLDDDNSMDDSVANQFSRNPDEMSASAHSNGAAHPTFTATMTNGTDGLYAIQQHPIVKQQPAVPSVVMNNKRAYHPTIPGKTIDRIAVSVLLQLFVQLQ